jgi:hypothetical protein
MDGKLKALDATSHRPPPGSVKILGNACVIPVGGAEHGFDLGIEIALITLLDMHRGDHHTLTISEGEEVANHEFFGEFVGNVENDWDRPENPAAEAHL